MARILRSAAVLLVLQVLALSASSACAQSMFIDADGDGIPTAADSVASQGETTLGVWLLTDQSLDGTQSLLTAQYGESLTVNSYEVVLRADGGTVEWGQFQNAQSTMTYDLGHASDSTECYAAYGGACRLVPGKYLLGTVTCRVRSGTPGIIIVPASHLGPDLGTSFGSRCPGRAGANTLSLGDPDAGSQASRVLYRKGRVIGDWHEARGVLSQSDPARIAARKQELTATQGSLEFRVVQVGASSGRAGSLAITTTRPGKLRVNIFDVQGRLIATLLNSEAVTAGVRVIPMAGPLRRVSSGIYFYRVEAAEGTRTGKVVLIR